MLKEHHFCMYSVLSSNTILKDSGAAFFSHVVLSNFSWKSLAQKLDS